jgi:hypothetical protein
VLLLLEIDARIREVLQAFSKTCYLAEKRRVRALARGKSFEGEKEGEKSKFLLTFMER